MPNRRQFLTGLIAAATLYHGVGASPLLSPDVAVTPSLTGEWGRAIPVGQGDELLAVELLIEDARKALRPGSVFEIRLSLPYDIGRHRHMAWYANQEMQSLAMTDGLPMEYDTKKGIYLVQRLRA